jgi:hypothetical protein
MKNQILFVFLLLSFLLVTVSISPLYTSHLQDKEVVSNFSMSRLGKFTRDTESISSLKADVLSVFNPIYNGINIKQVKRNAKIVGEMGSMACELLPDSNDEFKYRFKHKMITFGCEGHLTEEEIYYAIVMGRLFANKDAKVIVSWEKVSDDSIHSAKSAWTKAVKNLIVTNNFSEVLSDDKGTVCWVVGNYVKPETFCASEEITLIMYDYLNLDPKTSVTQYYMTSFAREREVEEAYRKDVRFCVYNTASAFHAATLSCLIKDIDIKIIPQKILEEPCIFESSCVFLKTYLTEGL